MFSIWFLRSLKVIVIASYDIILKDFFFLLFFSPFLQQRKKFVGESESLREQISKLEELLSSEKSILEVYVID